MIKNIFLATVVIAAYTLTGTSCKKSDSGSSNTDSGQVYMHLHTDIDTNEADYGTIYTDAHGRKISLSRAQLYLSNIRLIRTDGSVYAIPGIVYKTQETENYYLGKVPSGNYKSVMFNVGLDATTNAKAASADSALNHSEMWFGSSAQPDGYVFVNMEGSVDTTTAANGSAAQMQPFMFHLGTNAHLNTVTMPDHSPVYSVGSSAISYVHIIIDYSKLLNGVQLSNSSNLMIMSASDNSSATATTISNNVPSMFSYEE